MKKFPAMASVEFNGIAVGMHATDAMLKKSPISLLRSGTISRGHYLTLIGGSTASVEESLNEALFLGKENVIDHALLPDIDVRLHNAVLGERHPVRTGSLTIFETPTVSSTIYAAERALKSTPVDLVEIRLGDTQMGGRGMFILQGELHDIEAAVDAGAGFLQERGVQYVHRILTAPHEGMIEQLGISTRFNKAKNIEMEGELPS